MAEFGFYRVGDAVASSLTILIAPTLTDAKRMAIEAIEAEGLEEVRLWVDGQDVVEVRRPLQGTSMMPTSTTERGELMLARRSEGATVQVIAAEFGLSREAAAEALTNASRRAKLRAEQPNRAALPSRAHQLLMQVLIEPEDDPRERDRLLPERVAALTKCGIETVPNIGRGTITKIEAWLWERGLTLG